MDESLLMNFPALHKHQRKAVKELRNGCILKGGVGSGKTMTSISYYCQFAPWIQLYVITTAKKRDSKDWEEEAKLFGIEPIVDSWNNMYKYEDVKDAFFIFDEQRLVGSGVWVQAFIKIAKQNKWILLSATPGDTWMDYIPVFIANGFYKNRTEFVRRHVVFDRWAKYPKVERYLDERVLKSLRRRITVEMPYERHTERHMHYEFCDYDRELYDKVVKQRWNYLEERPIRQVSEMFSLMRRVVNSHESRIQTVEDLLHRYPRVIIFYNFDYELETLRELERPVNGITDERPDGHEVAEWNGHRHDEIPDSDYWIYLVQYQAGAEGWNCVDTDAMIFYSMNYSYRLFEQAQGRIDRINTPYTDLHYHVLSSSSSIDNGISKSLENKEDFNESRYVQELV